MTKNFFRLLVAILCPVIIGVLSFMPMQIVCIPACAESSASDSDDSVESICKRMELLVKEFYPKAKCSATDKSLHFEYKVKSEIGSSGRPMPAPTDGGILGDISLQPGEYAQNDKDQLRSEVQDGFHSVLTMAPYSKRRQSHLLAKLLFPSDVSIDFKKRFKELVDSFTANEATTAGTASTVAAPNQSSPADQQTGSGTSRATDAGPPAATSPTKVESNLTAAGTKSDKGASNSNKRPSEWTTINNSQAQFSVKFPTVHEETSPAPTVRMWHGAVNGVRYSVMIGGIKPPAVSPARLKSALDQIESGLTKGNNLRVDKKSKTYVFHGLASRDYICTAPDGTMAKALSCASPKTTYLFIAGGHPSIVPTESAQFFNSVKFAGH